MNKRLYLALRIAALAALVGFATVSSATAALTLEKNDRICIIGSGLADRMQHDGWLETVLQSAHPKHYLVIRNLGYTGDTVWSRPRNGGYPKQEDHLKQIKADVIFVMFGYNESFAGDGGLGKYADELGKLVDKYRGMKPNGKSAPKIVLFTPIAHEDLGNPNLPNGKANNARLAAYASATKEVAEVKNTEIVDLFGPSADLFRASNIPLTINGIHLNPEGNRRISEVIARSLLGKDVPASPSLENVRKAVRDKNWHWHNRYRATDGNDVPPCTHITPHTPHLPVYIPDLTPTHTPPPCIYTTPHTHPHPTSLHIYHTSHPPTPYLPAYIPHPPPSTHTTPHTPHLPTHQHLTSHMPIPTSPPHTYSTPIPHPHPQAQPPHQDHQAINKTLVCNVQ